MMVDRLQKSTPDGKLTVFKSGLFGRQNVWLSELKVPALQVFTARCTLVQSAVLRSHVVCPSVCPSVRRL